MINHIKRNIIIYAFGFVLLVMVINYMALYGKERMGEYGDIFGASNALFTGLALAFLIYGIFLQREEIRIAKEDLRRTKDILDEQSKYIRDQKFNDQFFSMVDLLSNYIINYKYGNNDIYGNTAIRKKKNYIFRGIKGGHTFNIVNMKKDDISEAIKILENKREYIDNEMYDIYQIIELSIEISLFLKRSNIDSEKDYINILRSVINRDLSNILCAYIHAKKDKDLVDILVNEYDIAYWP